MFLDPTGNGIEIWYDDKMRNLVGHIEQCTKYIIDISMEVYNESDDELVKEVKSMLKHKECNFVWFKGKKYIQYKEVKLDTNGFGRLWADYFNKIGLKFLKVDVKRINL